MKNYDHPSALEILGLLMAATRHGPKKKKLLLLANDGNLNNFLLNKGIITQGKAK